MEGWTKMTIDYGDKTVHCKNVHRLDPDQESTFSVGPQNRIRVDRNDRKRETKKEKKQTKKINSKERDKEEKEKRVLVSAV